MFRRQPIVLILILWLLCSLTLAPEASAAPPSVTLTTQVQPAGAGSVSPAGGSYKQGASITLTATPAPGWKFDHWGGDLTGTANPFKFKIRSNTTAIAYFVQAGTATATATRTPTRTSTPTPTRTVAPSPTPTLAPSDTPTPGPALSHEVVGYFTSWGIYDRSYLVKNIVTSGSAGKLTVVNYAFAGIDSALKCKLLDPWADYQKGFTASQSVDGVADSPAQPLKGNFNQLRKLKQLYPGLKVMMSIGGWTESYRFSDAAQPAQRAAFVASCVDMFIRGHFASGVTEPGIFDGIDIDWEYPGRCGATCDWRADDKQNFTALLAEFRDQLNAIDPNLMLTIAAPSSEYYYSQIELNLIPQYLNWVNLMTYDYHGSWEPNGPANHHSPLYSSSADPSEGQWSSDKTVQGYRTGGVPAQKLVLGLPFNGHGWSGVLDGGMHGLYQPAAGVAPGTYESGVDDFRTLEALGYPGYWDEQAQAYWIYNGSAFWSYDNAFSVSNKMGYVKAMSLRGVMFWELSGDDAQGTLITAIHDGLH